MHAKKNCVDEPRDAIQCDIARKRLQFALPSYWDPSIAMLEESRESAANQFRADVTVGIKLDVNSLVACLHRAGLTKLDIALRLHDDCTELRSGWHEGAVQTYQIGFDLAAESPRISPEHDHGHEQIKNRIEMAMIEERLQILAKWRNDGGRGVLGGEEWIKMLRMVVSDLRIKPERTGFIRAATFAEETILGSRSPDSRLHHEEVLALARGEWLLEWVRTNTARPSAADAAQQMEACMRRVDIEIHAKHMVLAEGSLAALERIIAIAYVWLMIDAGSENA